MGWLRLVGSLKLYVSFAEYSLFYRALLQKRPIILRSLLIAGTPYSETRRKESARQGKRGQERAGEGREGKRGQERARDGRRGGTLSSCMP